MREMTESDLGTMQEPAQDSQCHNRTQNHRAASVSSKQSQKKQQSSDRPLPDSVDTQRRDLQRMKLRRLWNFVLRNLVTTGALLLLLCLLTFIVAVVFYYVNRHGHTNSDHYRLLKIRQAEYTQSLAEVVEMARKPKAMNISLVLKKLHRLRQLGRNYAYKGISNAIKQHELKPTFTESLYYAVTLVSLIGYGDIAGASELQYFCASLSMLIAVPVWYMYHHQLYQLLYSVQLYCYRRWIKKSLPESRSNRNLISIWAARIHNANVYHRSRFYLSNLVLMLVMFPLCLGLLRIIESRLSLQDQLWLIVQSIFHIGLGDVNFQAAHWPVVFIMISTCFLIYFQCFAFIVPQYTSMRLSSFMKHY